MSTPKTATARPSRQSAVPLWIARSLLGVMGVAGLAGAAYFTFFASPEEGGVVTGFDWFVAGWKIVVSLGFVAVAVVPSMHRALRVQLATWLLLADVVFALLKIFGYDELESVVFLAVDVVLLGLFHVVRRHEQAGQV